MPKYILQQLIDTGVIQSSTETDDSVDNVGNKNFENSFIFATEQTDLDKTFDSDNLDTWDHHITFEIPSNLDLERIQNLDNFTSLTNHDSGIGISGYNEVELYQLMNSVNNFKQQDNKNDIMADNLIAKWSNNLESSGASVTTDNDDYQMILNYLWIGIVASLIVMSVIFIIFSCYFYRKFREWKRCNKDIRSQLPNDLYPHGNGGGNIMMNNSNYLENGYYQMMESPPCYTIATGLPSYDEALMQAAATSTDTSLQQQYHLQHNFDIYVDASSSMGAMGTSSHHPLLMMTSSSPMLVDSIGCNNSSSSSSISGNGTWEKPHIITECNYIWNEGNMFDTTNSVVITNLTDDNTITTTTDMINNNNSNNNNSSSSSSSSSNFDVDNRNNNNNNISSNCNNNNVYISNDNHNKNCGNKISKDLVKEIENKFLQYSSTTTKSSPSTSLCPTSISIPSILPSYVCDGNSEIQIAPIKTVSMTTDSQNHVVTMLDMKHEKGHHQQEYQQYQQHQQQQNGLNDVEQSSQHENQLQGLIENNEVSFKDNDFTEIVVMS